MSSPLVFSLFAAEPFLDALVLKTGFSRGEFERRHFPDGETYLRIVSDVSQKTVFILDSLDQPDQKIWPLVLMADTLRDLGARSVVLVAPYLGYMRQDTRFKPGEAITSRIFARIVSESFDGLLTVDPHLHRYVSLNEIYTIRAETLSASNAIANWIHEKIENPVWIGPDEESHQWIQEVARLSNAPFIVLKKIRHGDRNVEILFSDHQTMKDKTPIVLDDILSTGRTMIETVQSLKKNAFQAPLCIGVHALFSKQTMQALIDAGAKEVVTCNTVYHPSNQIDLLPELAKALLEW